MRILTIIICLLGLTGGLYASGNEDVVEERRAKLKVCVEYLEANASPIDRYLLDLVTRYPLVVIGETHHRPAYWKVLSELVEEPSFAEYVGTIYMELPCHKQNRIDEYLRSDMNDTALIIDMLRDMLVFGWPDQAMLEFFETVWRVNQSLDEEKKIRIVAVDMPRPWRFIQKRADWQVYETNRDRHMAELIIQDIELDTESAKTNSVNADKRHGLFIVGFYHVMSQLKLENGHNALHTSGWYLRKEFGEDVYLVLQHGAVMTNAGQVLGRRCDGLFDAALHGEQFRGVGFGLKSSPLGQEPFNIVGELGDRVQSRFEDAFDGYMYVCPLEEEIFSPLIEGFYDENFFEEINRRYQLMYSCTAADDLGLMDNTVDMFIEKMEEVWGKPQPWCEELETLDDWLVDDEK